MRRIPTLSSPIKGHVSIARSDLRKLVRVAREAEKNIKTLMSRFDLALALGDLNAVPKRKGKA